MKTKKEKSQVLIKVIGCSKHTTFFQVILFRETVHVIGNAIRKNGVFLCTDPMRVPDRLSEYI